MYSANDSSFLLLFFGGIWAENKQLSIEVKIWPTKWLKLQTLSTADTRAVTNVPLKRFLTSGYSGLTLYCVSASDKWHISDMKPLMINHNRFSSTV